MACKAETWARKRAFELTILSSGAFIAGYTSIDGYAVKVMLISPIPVRMVPLSHVAPAREVSMLFAALVGGTLLGEGDRWQGNAQGCGLQAGPVR